LEYELKTKHRDGWPRDWENVEPAELVIAEDSWRVNPEQPDQYLYTFKIRIPIRRQVRGDRFEFQLTVYDSESGRQCGNPSKFSWDFITDSLNVDVIPAWPEIVDPSNVEKHPVGPQKRGREILARLNQSGSFCVTAPRRFGKSTLVQFLQKKAQDAGFVVPNPIVCTSYYLGPQGLDYDKLWQDVSDLLQVELGSSITRTASGPVPTEHAFDHVRRAAKHASKKGIVILFDEAQLYFSTRLGFPLGDLVKDRLERHWSTDDSTMAPVMVGFIGLPTLQARAGANLSGLLRPISYNELEEVELNALILAVTSNALSTTREARRRLGNL
jgi:hypothetical protein